MINSLTKKNLYLKQSIMAHFVLFLSQRTS